MMERLCDKCKEFDKVMNGGKVSLDVFVECNHEIHLERQRDEFYGKEVTLTGDVQYVGDGEDPAKNPAMIAYKNACKAYRERPGEFEGISDGCDK